MNPHALVIDRARTKAWRVEGGGSVTTPYGWDITVLTDRAVPQHHNVDSSTTVAIVDCLSHDTLPEIARRIHAERPLSGITTTSELFLEDAARLREQLAISGPGIEYTTRLRDKWAMKQTARAAQVRHARGVLGSERSRADDLLRTVGRCVIKPRQLSGSRGVQIVSEPTELSGWLESTCAPDDFLIEEFIDAPLVHIDGLVVDGRMVWQLSAYNRPTHLAGGAVPLSSRTVDDPRLLRAAHAFLTRILQAFAITTDVFHCEAFATPGGLTLCEIAGRPGGAGVSEVFEATRGHNLRHAKTLLDLGLSPRPDKVSANHHHGGWTVFYEAGPFYGVDDNRLTLHHSREARTDGPPPAAGFAGVGVALYTYVADTAAAVDAAIGIYEREVRLRVDGRENPDR